MLQSLFSVPTNDDKSDALRAGLVAHAGNTDFTIHLYDEVQDYYHQSISGATTSSTAVLGKFKPKQDIINALSRATDTTTVADVVMNLSDTEKQGLLIWLFEIRSAREINNNDAVITAINELANDIQAFDSTHMQGLNTILANGSSAYEAGIKEFINTGTDLANMYKDFIAATLGL